MKPSVLVVGAGPSGLFLALALLRNGISVRIIEKTPKFGIGHRGCGIQPRTLEMHNFLGILPDILKLARIAPLIQVFSSPEGPKPIRELELSDTLPCTPFYPYINPLILGQDTHEGIFRSHIEKDYGCTVELGTRLESLEQHPDHVTAHLIKVVDGEEFHETATFDWLVGADGSRSAVRKQINLPFEGISRDSEFLVVGDVHIKKGLDRKHWRFWGNDFAQTMVALRPFEIEDDDRYNFMIGGEVLDHDKIASSRDELINIITTTSGKTDFEFGDVVWMGVWKPNIRMVDKFGVGRVFLVGDAAHAHTAAGGQGMNSSVQDSINLAWKLALVQKGLAPMSVLESYTEERVRVISAMLGTTTVVFDESIRYGGTGEGLTRDFELRQFGVNYRNSSIIIDEKYPPNGRLTDPYRAGDDGTVRGGDRAPDAPGLVSVKDSTVMKLFEIFRISHHTVLIFSDPTTDQSEVLKTLKCYPSGMIQTVVIYPQSTTPAIPELADYAFTDNDGHAYKHYNVIGKETVIMAIRPDGYVGALVGGVDGVKKYFDCIFTRE